MFPSPITFSHDGSPLLHVSLDGLTITHSPSSPGHHALIRATHCFSSTTSTSPFYYEVTIQPPTSPSPSSNPVYSPQCRVGFSRPSSPFDVPVGWGDSVGFIGRSGEAVHQSEVRGYGRGVGTGDVVGVTMKRAGAGMGLQVSFTVNGEEQGLAFDGVGEGLWYPTVSLYRHASITARFEPPFAFDFRYSLALNPLPLPTLSIPPTKSISTTSAWEMAVGRKLAHISRADFDCRVTWQFACDSDDEGDEETDTESPSRRLRRSHRHHKRRKRE